MRALGIDVGTSTTKVVLVEVDGGQVRERATRAARTPDDVPSLLRAVASGCRDVASGGAVDAVGVASMAETGVPVDSDGAALTGLLRWDAGLGGQDAAELAPEAAHVFTRSGVRLSAKTPLMTWRWLRRERPEIWRAMSTWLGAADLVAHALTGVAATDHTLAGRTGGYPLTPPGESLASDFDADLLRLAGIDAGRLPQVVGPDRPAGRITPSAAAATGLMTGVPVVVAGHDHQVAAWAAGVRAPGEVADSLGTAEAVLSVLAERPDLDRIHSQGMSLVQTVTGDDALVAGTSSAGAMLRHWLSAVPEPHRDAVLARAAQQAASDPEPTGAAVAPYLRGRQTPEPDPHARAGAPPADWPHERQARAVVEGICYQARWMIQTQLGPRAPRAVTVIGGERLPPLWATLKHATLPWPVSDVTASEPVAAGAALLALARTGALGDAVSVPTLAVSTAAPRGQDPHGRAYEAFVQRARAGLSVGDGSWQRSAAVD